MTTKRLDVDKTTVVLVIFFTCLIFGVLGILTIENNQVGTPKQTTNVCELNTSLVGRNIYYDNQSDVCWKPLDNKTVVRDK